MKSRTMLKRTEAEEQAALFEWAEWNSSLIPELQLMFHIPNGGSRNKAEAANLKRQGVKSGVPDIFLPVPRGKFAGLWIELKTVSGKASEEQKKYIQALNDVGYAAEVCHGFDSAVEVITKYIELGGGETYGDQKEDSIL